MTGPDDPEAYGEGPPESFCRAPEGKCVNISEFYAEKSCQFWPDESTYRPEGMLGVDGQLLYYRRSK